MKTNIQSGLANLGEVNRLLKTAYNTDEVAHLQQAQLLIGHTKKLLRRTVKTSSRAGLSDAYIAEKLGLNREHVRALLEED